MDNVLEQLFSMSTIILCLMIWILTWLQRKVVEYFWKKASDNKFWREILLPLGPVGTGGILGALVPQYPWPEDFKSLGARVIFGAVCGLGSAHVYRILNKFIAKKEAASGDAEGDGLLDAGDKKDEPKA